MAAFRRGPRRKGGFRPRLMLALAAVGFAPACVVGAEARPPRDQVVRGAWIPRAETAADDLAARDRVQVAGPPGGSEGGPPAPGSVWMAPYAHWSGAEYELAPGSYQEAAPAYTWRPHRREPRDEPKRAPNP